MQLFFPVFCKEQQSAIELFRLRVLPRGRISGIAITVEHFRDLSVFNLRRAVPRLNDKAVVRGDIAKGECFDVESWWKWHDFANRRHPATQQTIESLGDSLATNFRNVLVGVIGARRARRKHGLSIFCLFRANKIVPTRPAPAARWQCRSIGRPGWRRPLRWSSFLYHFLIRIVVPCEKLVGQQIRAGYSDLIHTEPEVRRIGLLK